MIGETDDRRFVPPPIQHGPNRAQRRAAMKAQPRNARRYDRGMGLIESPQQPSVGEQLGLGPVWAMTPTSIGFTPARSPQGKVHILRLATAIGVLGFAFTDAELANLRDMMTAQLSGLVVAEASPISPLVQ